MRNNCSRNGEYVEWKQDFPIFPSPDIIDHNLMYIFICPQVHILGSVTEEAGLMGRFLLTGKNEKPRN